MRKLYLILLLAVSTANATYAEETISPPYLSDMTEWSVENAGGENDWQRWSSVPYFTSMSATEKELTGCSDGIACDTEDADSWAISPAVELKAGVEYEISFFMVVPDAEVDYGDENVILNVAGGNSLTDITGGTELFATEGFNNTELTRQTATFTPTADGSYFFGLNCHSGNGMFGSYGIAATAFSIKGDDSGQTSGIDTIGIAREAEYFDITGVKVTKPVKGRLYIVRHGSKATKIIL